MKKIFGNFSVSFIALDCYSLTKNIKNIMYYSDACQIFIIRLKWKFYPLVNVESIKYLAKT